MNISMLLDMAADGYGDRIAVGSLADGVSYTGLRRGSAAVASELTRHGAARLVLASVNVNEIPALMFGSAQASAVFTAVNYRLADDKLREALERCSPAVVVADELTRPRVDGVDGLTYRSAADLIAAEILPADELSEGDPDGVAISLFTSGTSGAPKTVLLRHRNLVSYIITTTEFMGADDGEAALVSVPPYHVAGMASVLSNVYLGRRIVYMSQFDAQEWVDTVVRERITHAMIVPTMLGRILDVLDATGATLDTLQHLSYGGGRMPMPVVQRALDLLPDVSFVNAYGLTETSSTIALLGPDDHRAALRSDDEAVTARLGSVGRAVPGIELQVWGVDGRPVGPRVSGEIVVRGEQVSGEYDGNDTKDGAGWFRTNDNGWLDEEGYLFIEGRADDVIVRGGENMSPGEIEDVLLQHERVADVAVFGVPDEEWGEVVAAFVVPTDEAAVDPDELRQWVRDRLRSSRMPAVIEFRPALPYSETGKLLRRELRAALSGSGA
jgi:acyl-CoA synthetase (AMP-forming)/AMP-acid ligase II